MLGCGGAAFQSFSGVTGGVWWGLTAGLVRVRLGGLGVCMMGG